MITGNEISPLAPRLRVFVQHFKQSLLAFLEAKKGNSDVVLDGVQKLDRADAILKELESEEAAIATNARLSTIGKQEQMAATAKAYHERLSFLAKAATDRRNAARQLEQTFAAIPAAVDKDPLLDFMRCREVRERLAPLSTSERMKIVTQAMRNGDFLPVRALESDPLRATVPEGETEYLDRLKEERAKATDDGKAWIRHQSLIEVAERLEQLATAVDLQLSNYGQVPSFPGIQTRETDMAYTDQTAPPKKNPSADKAPAQQPQFQ